MTQAEALTILKTGANVFLTGEPGAGKTHTINEYVRYLREHEMDVAITASTGIAATHIGGMTIHSWSGIGIRRFLDPYTLDTIASNEYVSKRVRRAKILIIDEISMLSPETLEMVNAVCREVKGVDEPFGGLQVVFVGDFFQLPPVQSSVREPVPENLYSDIDPEPRAQFAYDSAAWKSATPVVCYLTEQHRQDDGELLSVLSAIRRNEFEQEHFECISLRTVTTENAPADVPRLFSHNADVDKINTSRLASISSEERFYIMNGTGNPKLIEILKKGCLSPETLILKTGAEVMFTKNNQKEGFSNGTLGTVISFQEQTRYPVVRTKEGKSIVVEPTDWSVEENGKIKAQISQLPLRLAWAITVHKSQGMSMDAAVMDLSSVFEYGQGYVALSRVRRLSGLHILGVNVRAFQVHPAVLERDEAFRLASEEAAAAFEALSKNELEKMHVNFIRVSGGTLLAQPVVEKKIAKKKTDTKTETLLLWEKGMSIAQIAKERSLKSLTIFDHLETLAKEGKIAPQEFERVASPKVMKNLASIGAAFAALDTDKLAPVFESLKGVYSYDELRVARMLLKK